MSGIFTCAWIKQTVGFNVGRLWCICVFLFCLLSSAFGSDLPAFTTNFTSSAVVESGAAQVSYAPNLSFPADKPVEITGPAEVTNATQLYVQFVRDSLGHTNLSGATAQTGFKLAGGGSTAIPGIVNPPENENPNNLYYPALGVLKDNQVWLMINYTPGTNDSIVTNTLRLIPLDGTNNLSTNWAMTNMELIVRPQQPLPSHLEVRFYNSSTNAADDVYILPTSSKGLVGSGFWWTNGAVGNNWTNWMTTTTNMTLTLADIGITGTNTQHQPYYAIYTTNFPNAKWFVCYNGGHLPVHTNADGKWDGTTMVGAGPNSEQPGVANTNGYWFGYEWNAFELTLGGSPADVGDVTYINEFSIPMAMRVFTNSYADAVAGVFTNRDSGSYYQIGGWTNFTRPLLSNAVAQMMRAFPFGVISNAAGTPVMLAGPSAAAAGTLGLSWASEPYVWPLFETYFDAVKSAQPERKAIIKDFIGLEGGGVTYRFYYDFELEITDDHALRLEGSMMVTNVPDHDHFYTNYTDLVLEVGEDAGPENSWASWLVYTAPTMANMITHPVLFNLADGVPSGLLTNLTAYSASASNQLGGTTITLTGSNFLGAVQVAFCGEDNALLPAEYQVLSDTNLLAHVPYGAVSGPIVVTTSPHGSGKSSGNLHVDGTAVQAGPVLSPSAQAPVITAFSPTNGRPAVPVLSISGDWAAIASATQTAPDDASPAVLYNSAFGSAVMGRIMGDLAAGFAFGFINSSVTNPAYAVDGTNRPYGDSPSGSWWGGNQYPAASTNKLVYSEVNTNLSQWGDIIYTATAVAYAHPIYDRMQGYGGADSRIATQPPVAPNHDPNIWAVEVEFYDGMGSVDTPIPSEQPRIDVLANNGQVIQNNEIASDQKGTAFGSVDVQSAMTNSYSITNNGSGLLTISSVTTGGVDAARFAVAGIPGDVAVGEASAFSIVFYAGSNRSIQCCAEHCQRCNKLALSHQFDRRGCGYRR